MKQSITAITVQYEFGKIAIEKEMVLTNSVRRIETRSGGETFSVIVYFKDDTMASLEFTNESIIMIKVVYGAGLVDWAPTLGPIKDAT